MPSEATTLSALEELFCSRMESTSAAYCLLLSNPSLRMRSSSQSRKGVVCPIVSDKGGMKDRRFSIMPRV